MWALQFTAIKLVEDQVGPLFTVWGPMALATLLLAPMILAERRAGSPRRGKPGDIWQYALLAIVAVFPAQVLVTWGTRMSTASNAAIIMLATPVWTAVFARLFLGERMNGVRWLSFAIGIGGVILCSRADLRNSAWQGGYLAGNLLILSGALGSAFYNSYGKKLLERYTPMEMLFYTYVAMLVILTPLVVAREPETLMRMPQFNTSTQRRPRSPCISSRSSACRSPRSRSVSGSAASPRPAG
ncbi:MAG: DMT family transporter, partial [Bryobacteraceae bacterium]